MDTTKTPWGRATVVEEAVVEHDALERRYDGLIQLLELRDGEQALRFAARAQGARRLSCLTLRGNELEELAEALLDAPRLASALRLALG